MQQEMKNDSLKIQIQQEREWISWQKEVNRLARVEIRLRETAIRRREKRLKKFTKSTN